MLILAIDDEPKMLRLLHRAIEEAAPDARIVDFSLGSAALAAIEKEKLLPSVIFTDIRMPKIDGLMLAVELKKLVPDAKLVFVTGYDEYALEAYRLHVNGYIMKPVDAGRIREELSNALAYLPDESGKLTVRCFGRFEVFWQGEPLSFSRRKTKELLAWLIDQRGASATAEEVIAALYKEMDMNELKAAKQNLRNLAHDLKSSLHGIGMDDVLIRKGGTIAIRTERLDCDYYRMLEGDMTAVNAFRGEYMEQYSWAEITKAGLYFGQLEKRQTL